MKKEVIIILIVLIILLSAGCVKTDESGQIIVDVSSIQEKVVKNPPPMSTKFVPEAPEMLKDLNFNIDPVDCKEKIYNLVPKHLILSSDESSSDVWRLIPCDEVTSNIPECTVYGNFWEDETPITRSANSGFQLSSQAGNYYIDAGTLDYYRRILDVNNFVKGDRTFSVKFVLKKSDLIEENDNQEFRKFEVFDYNIKSCNWIDDYT